MAKNSKYSDASVKTLCQCLEVDSDFLMACLEASAIDIREEENHLRLDNGSILRLRRLERLCHTFQVDVPMAVRILALTQRVVELEDELRTMRSRWEK